MQKASRRTEISFCSKISIGPLQALRMQVIASIFCFLNWFSTLKVQAVAWGRLPEGESCEERARDQLGAGRRGKGKGKGRIDSNGGIVGYIS